MSFEPAEPTKIATNFTRKQDSPLYKRYVLATITSVYVCSLLDRGLISLLLQPIKKDLQLSDTQLGLLTGIVFALFYATLALPMARWADRGNRVTISSVAIGVWGLTVMACLFVTTYPQLVVARIAAAVGESGCKPPTYSLVGDYFPQPAERMRAMSIYWLGGPLTSLIGYTLGGWLNELYGWRVTFFLIGIPGLVLAVLVKLTLIEPRTHGSGPRIQKPTPPPVRAVLRALWYQQSCRHLTIALILHFTMDAGVVEWSLAFMMRSHGMGTAELGVWMGLISGLVGAASVLLGGYLPGRWCGDNERSQMRVIAVATALLLPCYVLFLTVPHKYLALSMVVPWTLLGSFYIAPTFTLLQRLVPDEMRATVLAAVMLLVYLIAFTVGPQIIGSVSDLLSPALGAESLRYAMLVMPILALWSAYHFWKAGVSVKGDLLSAVRNRQAIGDLNNPEQRNLQVAREPVQ